jgi:hypothetical protein
VLSTTIKLFGFLLFQDYHYSFLIMFVVDVTLCTLCNCPVSFPFLTPLINRWDDQVVRIDQVICFSRLVKLLEVTLKI